MSATGGEHRDCTKRRIQRIALELFCENGYDATSMQALANEANLTKAALYYHFKGKEDIVRSILDDFWAQVDELVTWAGSEPLPSPEEILDRWALVMRRDGMQLTRFTHVNQRIVRDINGDGGTLRDRLRPLVALMAPEKDSAVVQMRIRMALLGVQLNAMLASDLGVDAEEMYEASLQVGRELLALNG